MPVPHHPVDACRTGPAPRAVLRLFAAARQAAGTGRVDVSGATVGAVLDWARSEFGAPFVAVLDASRVWCNGQPAEPGTLLADGDEVAVLPPVSGGACGLAAVPGGAGRPSRPGAGPVG